MNPTFDLKFQIKILALLTTQTDFLERYGPIIRPEYFADPIHQRICRLVNEFWQKYEKAPTLEVIIEEVEKEKNATVQGAMAEVLEEVLSCEMEDVGYYTDHVIEFCQRQSILLALKGAAEKLKEGDLDTIVPGFEEALRVGQSMADDDLGFDYWTDLEVKPVELIPHKVPTLLGAVGSGGLDDVLDGGLDQGEFGIIMLPSGKGKSVTLLNLGGNAILQGYNVAYITLEISEAKLVQRFNSFFTGLTRQELKGIPAPEIREYIQGTYRNVKMGDLMIKLFPSRTVTIRQIENHLRTIQYKKGWWPDLILIDYMDIVRPPRARKEPWQELIEISDEIFALAQRYKTRIWTASQVKQGAAKQKIIKAEDGGGAYGKVFAADIVLTANPTTDPETGRKTMKVFVAKNRDNEDEKTLDYEMDLPRMKIHYMEHMNTVQASLNTFMKRSRGDYEGV